MIVLAWRLVPAIALVVLASCGPGDRSAAVEEGVARSLSPGAAEQLAQLRRLIAPFHDFESAQAAGWSMTLTECLENPDVGVNGHHLGSGGSIEEALRLEPDLLVYEPQRNGKFRLVAIEYVIPFSVLSANADPPVLLGQEFHQNLVFGVWALHVPLAGHDPGGMLEASGPSVSCAYATATGELRPDEATALVSGACLRARAGLEEEAVRLLERAFALGRRDRMGRDPDCDRPREDLHLE